MTHPQAPHDIPSPRLADALFRHVDLLAGVIGPRHPGKPAALQAAAAYIESSLQAFGMAVRRESWTVAEQTTCNLIAEIPGVRHAHDIVILGAHYDSVAGSPGADDNASAVAVLIETAHLLQGQQPGRTIRFVAFSCEEAPWFHTQAMGSQVHAQQCRARGEHITGMLCLEMVGYYCSEPDSQRLPPGIPRWMRWAFPNRGNFLAAVGNPASWRLCVQFRRGFRRGTSFPLFPIVLPERISEIRRSDNSSFWDQGIPALMLTDTSFLRNPHYHQPTDLPDTLNFNHMAEVTRGVASALLLLAR